MAPGEIVTDWGEPEARPIAKSAPRPATATGCGLPGALSTTDTVPLKGPAAVGAKVTWITQLPSAATLDPQLFVSLKPALEEMLVIVNGVPPEFISVTACTALIVETDWEGKVRVAGENVTEALGVSPVPMRLTICALSIALSENVRSAVAIAGTVGENVTLTEQVAFGAMVEPVHVSEPIANCAASVPESVVPPKPKIKLAIPLFVTVMVCGELEVFTIWLKVMLEAERVTAGAGATGLISNTMPSWTDPPTSVVP